jgi:hypothetical protein
MITFMEVLRYGSRLLASVRLASWFLAVLVVAVCAGRRHRVAGIKDTVRAFRLRRPVSRHSSVSKFLNESRPIRIANRRSPSVSALTSWNRKQVGGLRKREGAVFDSFPSSVDTAERICRDTRVGGRRDGSRIIGLRSKDDVRVWEKNTSHHLQEIAVNLRDGVWRRRFWLRASIDKNDRSAQDASGK